MFRVMCKIIDLMNIFDFIMYLILSKKCRYCYICKAFENKLTIA